MHIEKFLKYIPLVGLFVFASCSPYEKVLKSKDYAFKLEKANEYYSLGKWFRARELYSQVLPVYRATKDYEDIFYNYAHSLYNSKDYLNAAYHFKNFTEFFPSSPRAEECLFMHGLCLYKDSPNPSLDPTSTIKAREVLVTFVNTHPASKYLDEAMKYITECTDKLELKDYNAAMLYYNMDQFRAAAVAFHQLNEKFVETKKSEYYTFMRFKSLYKFAKNSEFSKQEERYVQALDVFKEFKNYYSNSKYIAEANKYVAEAENALKQLRNEHK
jgi:outer membrane protein assembly factor BamD